MMNAIKLIIERFVRRVLLSCPEKRGVAPLFSVVFVCALVAHSGVAVADCSASYFEKAYLNEYYFGTSTNYLEVFIPNNNQVTSADWSSWKVTVYTGAGSFTSYPMSDAQVCSFGSKTYLTYNVAALPGTGGAVNAVLYDGSGNEIDYLKFDNSASIPVYIAPQCSYASSHDIDLVVGNYGNKDVARFPDGKGDWSISNLTGANTTNTRCSSNDATIIKTVSASSIPIGSSASFIITAANPSNGSLGSVTVTDVLPSGLIYESHSATTGTTYTPGTGIWNIGALAKNTAVILTINFHGNTAGTYTNTATLNFTGITYPASDSAIANIVQSVSNFNAFESTTAAAAITGVIKTKIAGSAFALDVVAISAGAQSTGFTNNVKVELLANTGVSGSGYGADNCPTSNSVIQTINSALITGGRSTVNFPAVAEAYRDVRVRISYPTTTPTVTVCSTDSFAIRPGILAISATDLDWQTAGTTRTLNNTAATGGLVHKAGQAFTLAGAAYNAAATPAITANYAGAPAAILSNCAPATACTASFGTFTQGATFTAGVLNSTTASYSEAGAFNLQLQDSNFAVIDAGNNSADCTASGYFVCSPVTAVGRFVPDHFDTAVLVLGGVPMACPPGLTCPALNATVPAVTGMVYAGQSFTLQITARNAADVTTANYNSTSGLSKNITLSAWDALGGATAGTGTLAGNTILASAFSNGVASTASTGYSFAAMPTVPAAIYLRAQDGDGVTSLRAPASGSHEGGVEVVNGRIKILNAYGSELLPLALTATVQYYNPAGSWVTSSSDTLTAFAASDFALAFPAATANKLAACETALSVTGSSPIFKINLSAPGAGNSGWTDLTLNLGAVAVGNRCTVVGGAGAASTTANRPWLQFPAGLNPTARATFGVYSGNNNLIYQRESY